MEKKLFPIFQIYFAKYNIDEIFFKCHKDFEIFILL